MLLRVLLGDIVKVFFAPEVSALLLVSLAFKLDLKLHTSKVQYAYKLVLLLLKKLMPSLIVKVRIGEPLVILLILINFFLFSSPDNSWP